MAKKSRKPVETAPQPEQVSCIYCGRTENLDTIEVDEHNHERTRKLFHCLPVLITGDPESAKERAVCLDCTFKKRSQLQQEYPEWFRRHKNLPVLTMTIQKEEEFAQKAKQAMERAKNYREKQGIEVDQERTCCHCGHHHGEIVEGDNFGERNFYYVVTNVAWTRGKHNNMHFINKNGLCYKCRPIVRETHQTASYDKAVEIAEQIVAKKQAQEESRVAKEKEQRRTTLTVDPRRYMPKGTHRGIKTARTGTDNRWA